MSGGATEWKKHREKNSPLAYQAMTQFFSDQLQQLCNDMERKEQDPINAYNIVMAMVVYLEKCQEEMELVQGSVK
jgi:hypothetical protein